MAAFLFIRVIEFDAQAPQVARIEWVRVDGERLLTGMVRGGLDTLPQVGENEMQVVSIPGNEVLLTRVRLPGGNRQKLLRAAPYAIEDLLIDEVDSQHVALGERDAEGYYPLAAVSRDYLAALLAALAEAGLSPRYVLPDFLCLPQGEDSWTVLLDGGVACVRTGPQEGFSCDADNLAELLSLAVAENETGPARIQVCFPPGGEDGGEDAALLAALRERLGEVEILATEIPLGSVGEWLALSVRPAEGINFLQGAFTPETAWQGRLRPWRAAAAVFAVWLVIQLGFTGYRYYDLHQQEAALQAQMEAVFRQAFPRSRIVRGQLKEYMAQLVARMRGGGGGEAYSLAQMLSEVGPALGRSGVSVQSIQYRNGRLDLRLEAKDLASIDNLKQVLAANGKWQVESETTSRGGKVDSVLHIEGRA